jgi:hypothetical protein
MQKWKKSSSKNKQAMKKLIFIVAAAMLAACSGGGSSSSSSNADTKLIPAGQGDKRGYVDKKGTWVINPQFDDADWFRHGLARVYSDGKVGFIDSKGAYKIDPIYKAATPFFEGLAWVVAEGGAPTAIDTSGKEKFVLKDAKKVMSFSDGLAVFTNADGQYGYVDKSGNIVINPQFELAFRFQEGLAGFVQGGDGGYINKKGEIVINPQFSGSGGFSEGLAAIYNGDYVGGYIDTKGTYVVNPQFESVGHFSEGMASIENDDYEYGYIDKEGKIIINPQFDDAGRFFSGLAWVEQGDKTGFIDKKGTFVINPQFNDVTDFYGDFALVDSGGRWGLIDKKGKYIVNPQFDGMWPIRDNFEVDSDYYDPAPIVNALFEKAEGTTSFDGFTIGSTLQTVKDHPVYGKAIEQTEKMLRAAESIELAEGVTASPRLFFATPIYSMETTYTTVWGRQRASGSRKAYNYELPISFTEYVITLRGDAQGRNITISEAIKAEIEKRYGVTMTSSEPNDDGVLEYGIFRDGALSFVIHSLGETSLALYVGFERAELEKIFNS